MSNFKNNQKNKITRTVLGLVVVLTIFIFSYAVAPLSSFATINKQINYQGKLTTPSSIAVADGNYNMTFGLYTAASGGSPIWTESFCYSPDNGVTCNGTGADQRVPVASGLFSTMLGSVHSLVGIDFNQTLYLGVKIQGASSTPSAELEMTPRKIIGSVPSAFVADTLQGLTPSSFFRTDAANSTTSTSTYLSVAQSGVGKIAEFFGPGAASAFTILSNGFVGIGTTTPFTNLSVVGNEFLSGNLTAASFIKSGGTSSQFLKADGSVDSTAYVSTTSVASLYVPYSGATGAVDLNNKALSNLSTLSVGSATAPTGGVAYFNGNVGIGTTGPLAALDVLSANVNTSSNGNVLIRSNDSASIDKGGQLSLGGYYTGTSGVTTFGTIAGRKENNTSANYNGYLSFGTASVITGSVAEKMRITSTGNVGIGTTSPISTLSVRGTAGTNPFTIASSTNSNLFEINQAGAILVGNTAGSAGQILQTNGTTGVPTWVTASAGETNHLLLGSGFLYTATSTDGIKAAYFTATSTTATSTFAGGLTVGTSKFVVQQGGNVGIGTVSPTHKLDIVAGTLDSTQNALSLTGTLNSTDVAQTGVNISIVGSGAGSVATQNALSVSLTAGYTGSVGTNVVNATNFSAGTGADFTASLRNSSFNAVSRGTTVGDNVGGSFVARGGNVNVALFGQAVITKNSATNVGVVGMGLNGGSSPIQVGGYFATASAKPNFESSALIADNGSQTNPILLLRDNGTTVFSVIDGGNVGIGTTTPGQTLTVVGTTDSTLGFYNNGAFFGIATGTRNFLIGYNTRATTTANTGYDNFFVGSNSGQNNTTGGYNNFLGLNAGSSNTSGLQNNFFGVNAGLGNTTGYSNEFIGSNTGSKNTIGAANVVIGDNAMKNSVGSAGEYSRNTIVGYGAGTTFSGSPYSNNSLFGYQAALGITTGTQNLMLGYNVGTTTTTGSNNILIGSVLARSASDSNFLNIGNAIYGDLSTGNVGIGTVSPGTKLEVAGTASSTGLQVNGNGVITGSLNVGSSGTTGNVLSITNSIGTYTLNNYSLTTPSSFLINAAGYNQLSDGTGSTLKLDNGGNIILTPNGGNVGIGTPNPLYTLSLTDTAPSTIGTKGPNGLTGIGFDSTDSDEKLTFTTIGTEVMRIDNSGHVGIGTTTSGYSLTVAGDTSITGALRFSGNAGASGQILQSTGSTAQWVATGTLGFLSSTLAASTYVPYTGATGPVNLNNQSLTNVNTFSANGLASVSYLNTSSTTANSTFAGPISVTAPCITAETKIRRRKRRGINVAGGEPEDDFEDVPVTSIDEGDEVQSYDEKTGDLVWKEVKAVYETGIQTIWTLTTATGKSIRTTAEHPYFVKNDSADAVFSSTHSGYVNRKKIKNGTWKKVKSLTVGMTIAVIDTTNRTVAWDTIKSVSVGAAEQVYDLEIADTHNFIANDIVAHNTIGTAITSNGNVVATGTLQILQDTTLALITGDVTGNARGTSALDIQSVRGNATQVASGNCSIAVGLCNTSSAIYTSAFGYHNTVTNNNNSAVGVGNTSSGSTYYGTGGAAAFGYSNNASGKQSLAFGYCNAASGNASVAFGRSNCVSASGASAFGTGITNGIASSAMIGPSNTAKLTILSTGETQAPFFTATSTTATSTFNYNVYVAGALKVIQPTTLATIIGDTTGNARGTSALDIQSVRGAVTQVASGSGSTAVGQCNTSSGFDSSAFGFCNLACGNYASALGNSNLSCGTYYSSAFGYQNTASANYSAAFGYFNRSTACGAPAFGVSNCSSACFASTFGYSNTASACFASAFGQCNTASALRSQIFGLWNFSGTGGLASVAVGVLNNSTGGTLTNSTGDITGTPAACTTIGYSSSAVGICNVTSGLYGSAFGYKNTASAYWSSALGYRNTASGCKSSASGYCNTASGCLASALGYRNTASGNDSSASGFLNTASGYASSASGYYNSASGYKTSGFGYCNTSSGCLSSAFGYHNTASACSSSAFGSCVINGIASSTMIGSSNTAKLTILSTGETQAPFFTATSTTATSTFNYNIYVAGAAKIIQPTTLATIIGDVTGNARGTSALDIQSKRGLGTQVASGNCSVAVGGSNIACGAGASAFGVSNTASGNFSSASGYQNTASGVASVAFGFSNTASSTNASAFGFANSASGNYSSASGYQNIASGSYSSAFGQSNISSGDCSSASGYYNCASGACSSVFGFCNTTSACNSSAFGSNITNSIANSTMIGPSNTAKLTILSTGETQAPFFTATSTTATSTFNYDVSVAGRLKVQQATTLATIIGDTTGNARGASALDIQSARSAATQVASGINSTAVGLRNTACGNGSFASGYHNTASGQGSSASGYCNTASNTNSSASGSYNTASGTNSSVFGYNNIASACLSSAFGSNITNATANSTMIGPSNTAKLTILSTGETQAPFFTATSTTATSTFNYDVSVAGRLKVQQATTLATIIGDVTGNARGASSLDIQSIRGAATEVASGACSVAIGICNTTSSAYGRSTAVGVRNTVSGSMCSSAFGFFNTASGDYGSVAVGTCNTAGGYGGVAIGRCNTTANTGCSMSFGGNNTACCGSIAFGKNNVSTGSGAIASAFGTNNSASGNYSAAFGSFNCTLAGQSYAFGGVNVTNAACSSAFGRSNTTCAVFASAFGACNLACAACSNAFGYCNSVNASGASAFGSGITNATANSTMIGPSDTAKLTILSTGETQAPFFTATSTTATSTFNYDVSVAGRLKVIQPTTLAVIIGDTTGNARGASALDIQTLRTNVNRVASGACSVAIGVNNSTCNAALSTAVGVCNGSTSACATNVGYHNFSTGYVGIGMCNSGSTIGVGVCNSGGGANSSAIGYANVSSGMSASAIGWGNAASGYFSQSFGYQNVTAAYEDTAFGLLNAVTEERSGSGYGYSENQCSTAIGNHNTINTNSNSFSDYYGTHVGCAQSFNNAAVGLCNTISAYSGYGTTACDVHVCNSVAFGLCNTITSSGYHLVDNNLIFGSCNCLSGDSQNLIFGYGNSIPAGYSGASIFGSGITLGNNSSTEIGPSDYAKVVVGGGGQFGIGTGNNTIGSKLSVCGNAAFGTYANLAAPTNGLIVSGRGGFGTSTPGYSLSVKGVAGTNPFVVASSTDAQLFTILSNGNVGIGTSSPVSKLSVAGLVTADNFYATSTTATSTFAGGLNVGNGALKYDWASGQTSIDNLTLGSFSFDTNAGMVNWADMPVTSVATAGTVESYTAQINGNPLLTIYAQSDGSGGIQNKAVGIGTTTPSTLLTVAGTSTVQTILPQTNLTYDLGSTGQRFNQGWISTLNIGTSTWSLTQGSGGNFSIFDAPSGGGNQRFSILSTGEVQGSIFTATSTTATSTFNYDVSVAGAIKAIQNTTLATIIGDTTGNARGTSALDIQSARSAATQVASGACGVAIGMCNTASGVSAPSIAIGIGNISSGYYTPSVAVGNGNSSTGSFGSSNAFGTGNSASANYSQAFGLNNQTTGQSALSFGVSNSASGSYSLAAGFHNCVTSSGSNSSAIGSCITNSIANSVQIGSSNAAKLTILSTGETKAPFFTATSTTATSTFNYDVYVAGRLKVIQPTTLATIIGDTTGNVRGGNSIDIQSTRSSVNQVASGSHSTALGLCNTASALYSTAVGKNNNALCDRSSAFGYMNTASNYYSSAFGYCNCACGFMSSASGYLNTASGYRSTAFGSGNCASSDCSSAFGYGNKASVLYSSAFGLCNCASACRSSAFGSCITNTIAGSAMLGPSNTAKLTILSTGETQAPFFTATSTTATSTFNGGFKVTGNAQFTAVGSGATANDLRITSDGTLTTNTSDARLKTNIETLDTSTLDKVLQLNPVSFNWLADPTGPRDLGFLAQDVQKLFPETVFTNATDGYMGINYSRFPSILAKAIQQEHASTTAALANLNVRVDGVQSTASSTAYLMDASSSLNASGTNSNYAATAGAIAVDKNLIENSAAIDNGSILDKINSLNIEKWNYTNASSGSHIGPSAQDFYKTFNLGNSSSTISIVDLGGVALAGVKGLSAKVDLNNASTILAISNLDQKVQTVDDFMRSMISTSTPASTTSAVVTFSDSFIGSLQSAFSGATDWVFGQITATLGIFQKVQTKELCLDDVCLTKDELKNLLDKNNVLAHVDVATSTAGVVVAAPVDVTPTAVAPTSDVFTMTSSDFSTSTVGSTTVDTSVSSVDATSTTPTLSANPEPTVVVPETAPSPETTVAPSPAPTSTDAPITDAPVTDALVTPTN